MADGATPGIQQQLGAAGECPAVRFGGNVYRLGHPTQAAKARLEDLAAETAVARVEAMHGRVKPATFQKMLDRVTDRITVEDFRTWREGWQEVVWGGGGILFALSLFREHHPGMTLAECEQLVETCGRQYKAALARVLPGFFDLLLAGREETTPEQAAAVRAALEEALAQLLPPQPQPQPPQPPTPVSTAT